LLLPKQHSNHPVYLRASAANKMLHLQWHGRAVLNELYLFTGNPPSNAATGFFLPEKVLLTSV
jgi:hypothetical protein